jgi:hypothetical protein
MLSCIVDRNVRGKPKMIGGVRIVEMGDLLYAPDIDVYED